MFSPPASAPVKNITTIRNDKSLPVVRLVGVSHAFVQAFLKREMSIHPPPGCGKLSGEVINFLTFQYTTAFSKPAGSGICS